MIKYLLYISNTYNQIKFSSTLSLFKFSYFKFFNILIITKMANNSIGNGDSSKQIKQMVNFIMQEANEKVNEIRIKV